MKNCTVGNGTKATVSTRGVVLVRVATAFLSRAFMYVSLTLPQSQKWKLNTLCFPHSFLGGGCLPWVVFV